MRKMILIAFLFISISSLAQDTVFFKSALFAMTPHRYGREAVYTHELLCKFYSGENKKPAAGQVFGLNDEGEEIRWQPIQADSANRLRPAFDRNMRRRFGGGGYMYLTYHSGKNQKALLNIKGNSAVLVNGEMHAGDPYSSGWFYVPVQLKKGLNEFYVRGLFVTASLHFSQQEISLNTEDPTQPHIITGEKNDSLQAAIVVINQSDKIQNGLKLQASINGKTVETPVPSIPAMSTRKVMFYHDASSVKEKGRPGIQLALVSGSRKLDEKTLAFESVNPGEHYSGTFVSEIDGSLQYYGVAPQIGQTENSALFLSVHGAGVEAIGQARAYKPKDWGTLVAPTNRRPRGFNWEDWGRIDALEVLNIARQKFNPDPQKIYLTGHSMGGHGTWFLGASYPDKWAAIAPCAGYPTLKGYGTADGLIPDSSGSAMEQVLLRSSNQSDMIKLATNYRPLGVYIFHGDSDRVVSVNYARQMKKVLSDFHPDYSYYEYPGGSHWFGDHSVDWKPIFDYFKWHQRPIDSTVNIIDFKTASPGISASYYWATIHQQEIPLDYSRIILQRDLMRGSISGSTENTRLLKLKLDDFGAGKEVRILLDSHTVIKYTTRTATDSIYLVHETNSWKITGAPSDTEKGPHRYGTLKDAFNHRMVFVYSSSGTKEENSWSLQKARLDAETWYYRGNGAVDIIADKDFNLEKYKDRGVILYGHANSNAAWPLLLGDCPIQLKRGEVIVGTEKFNGGDHAAYFVWPIRGSKRSSVAVIGGTGIKGMQAANANQYFAGASGFPDYMIFHFNILKDGSQAVKKAGFFNYKWEL